MVDGSAVSAEAHCSKIRTTTTETTFCKSLKHSFLFMSVLLELSVQRRLVGQQLFFAEIQNLVKNFRPLDAGKKNLRPSGLSCVGGRSGCDGASAPFSRNLTPQPNIHLYSVDRPLRGQTDRRPGEEQPVAEEQSEGGESASLFFATCLESS